MPVLEVAQNNIAANTQNLNVINGLRASQIDMQVKAASIKLLAVASAVGLTHALWIGSRNPLEVSPVQVSATPNQLLDPDNVIVAGVVGTRGETIRLFVSETAGVATNDYRARLIVTELG
tara:strand:+ start:551 stop:910 length:360 start_codon:yes stop_codon:yes gene_type:complete